MAFNDLSAQAQTGLNYAANKQLNGDGGQLYANGKAYLDHLGEIEGLQWYALKEKALAERRHRLLSKAENAALAAQVDALTDAG